MPVSARDWWHSTTENVDFTLDRLNDFDSNTIRSQVCHEFVTINIWLHDNIWFEFCMLAGDISKPFDISPPLEGI